jgi:hypothetical protein
VEGPILGPDDLAPADDFRDEIVDDDPLEGDDLLDEPITSGAEPYLWVGGEDDEEEDEDEEDEEEEQASQEGGKEKPDKDEVDQ